MPDKRTCVDNAVYKVAKKILEGIIERFIDDPETQIRFEKLLRPYAKQLEIGLPYEHKVLIAIDRATEDELIKYGFWPEIKTFRSQLLSGVIVPVLACPRCNSGAVDTQAYRRFKVKAGELAGEIGKDVGQSPGGVIHLFFGAATLSYTERDLELQPFGQDIIKCRACGWEPGVSTSMFDLLKGGPRRSAVMPDKSFDESDIETRFE